MKNLVLLENLIEDTTIKDANILACDNMNDVIYIATNMTVTGYHTVDKQVENFISLVEHDYLEANGKEKIQSLHYLFDQESVCISTTKGDLLLWQPELNNIECVGSVDAGFTCAQWSPDHELLVLTTGNDTFVLMTKDFDAICEHNQHSQEFGEAMPVNVGWGKKETQFHGSEGKEAAQQKENKVSQILSSDDKRTEVSWRGDGQYFCISSVNTNEERRYVRIYDRDGTLQATNEVLEGLENLISWRPSGNWIATSQRKPNKHDIIFLEKNGLQHGEFTLPYNKDQKAIVEMSWNMDSDVFTLLLRDTMSGMFSVQLWTVDNYHWYLKQEINTGNSQPCVTWDPEDSYKLHILKSDGVYMQHIYKYDIIQSIGEDHLSMVAVIDGLKLLLTPFKKMILPPPMAAHTINLDCSINLVAFGVDTTRHDIITQVSDRSFYLIKYTEENSYDKPIKLQSGDELMPCCLRSIVWLKENVIAALVDDTEGNYVLFLSLSEENSKVCLHVSSKLRVNENIIMLFRSEDSQQCLLAQDWRGHILRINQESYTVSDCSLPQGCSRVACTKFNGEDIAFGLTKHHRLFMNKKEIASNCTSFLLHEEFLLLTTHSHTLRSVYLNSLAKVTKLDDECTYCVDEAVRRVERGSKLVTAVHQGTAVVLQMPRGNLECIHPRALVVSYLQKLLKNLNYEKAFEVMRRNRINLNLIYDHNPKLFLENVNKFIKDIPTINYLNLFLADLTPEDVCSTLYFPFYHHGEVAIDANRKKTSSTKVDIVCQAVRNAIERSGNEKYFLALLTTYAKQSSPDLETVLVKIKQSKDHPSTENNSVSYDKALNYILYLIDVNQLFDIALGLYDFKIVLMVAERSQKDPKEYLPFLNNFRNMETNYQHYSIDKYLKKYQKALVSLAKCEDCFNECLEFVKEQRLHRQALKLFPVTSEQYRKLSLQYGEYLRQQKLHEDAGIVLSRSGHHREALEAFLQTNNWSMVLTEAKELAYTNDQIIKLCRELSEKLKSNRLYDEAAFLLEVYVQDVEECVVCLLDGGLWFKALQLIKKHERDDLIETNLKPSIHNHYEQTVEKLEDLQAKFKTYESRLKVVIEKKARENMEILEGVRDDPDNDLYSDISSITGQSVTTASSKGSRSSGHSRKSRSKVARKKYSLREGSKHEDFALREALAEIVRTSDQMKEEVSALLKALVLYHFEEKASNLQNLFNELLQLIETKIKEIWNNESTSNDAVCTYGPEATVQSILAQRQNVLAMEKDQLPPAIRPVVRDINWKLHLLRT